MIYIYTLFMFEIFLCSGEVSYFFLLLVILFKILNTFFVIRKNKSKKNESFEIFKIEYILSELKIVSDTSTFEFSFILCMDTSQFEHLWFCQFIDNFGMFNGNPKMITQLYVLNFGVVLFINNLWSGNY